MLLALLVSVQVASDGEGGIPNVVFWGIPGNLYSVGLGRVGCVDGGNCEIVLSHRSRGLLAKV